MAEIVQLHIENTIPELEQMERIGLFSREEIRTIVKRRKALEYTLRRRKKVKEDFLKYIHYEINLLTLIGKRRERLQCDLKKKEIDHVIAARINKLFKAVILRFQDDVKLWLSQIEFCKRMKWYHSISALFARMLQIHNSNPALWVTAAKWEMEENNAPDNARQLLQRGLRYHPNSQHLWTEYFRMELMYSDLVRKRREILGLQEIMETGEDNDAVIDGSVASVVYKNATAAVNDVTFALSFLPICQQFDFTSKHIDDIFDDVQRRFPEAEETLDAVAKRPLLDLNEEIASRIQMGEKKKNILWDLEEKVCDNYEKALEKITSEKMWGFYIDFNMERLKSTKREKYQIKIQSKLLDLFERASASDNLSHIHYSEWVRLLCCSGNDEKSLTIALEAARKWPKKISLWHLCLSLHIQARKEVKVIYTLFNEALNSVAEKKSFPLWQLGMQWLSLANQSKLSSFFENGIQSCKEVSIPMKEMYLEVIALQEGVQNARELYKRLKTTYPLSPEFFKKMIQIENAQLKPSIEWLRKCYEDAIKEFGSTHVDLWINFIMLEMEHPDGNPALHGMLYWRAMKMLDAEYTDEFITRATLYATHNSQSVAYSIL